MENVTIVGTEAGVLVLATEAGERFALPIDAVLQREIRRATRQAEPAAQKLAASPRDIQAQIRAGLTAAEVAELLGISVDDVARFEGPVLAEREHIIGQALAVPVLIGSEVEPDAQPTFGAAVRAKLAEVSASSERWASWKEESGWIIKLEFSANDVEHDARWSFDPRRSALSPLNADATQLSRQGSLPEGLIPACARWRPTVPPRPIRTTAVSIRVPSVPASCRRPPRRRRSRRSRAFGTGGPGRGDQPRSRLRLDEPGDRGPPRGPASSPRTAGAVADRARGRGDPGGFRPDRPVRRARGAGRRARGSGTRTASARVGRQRGQRTPTAPQRDAVVGRDRLRSAHRRVIVPGPRQEAKAPNRRNGTRVSSGVSAPCCPTIPRLRWSSAVPS